MTASGSTLDPGAASSSGSDYTVTFQPSGRRGPAAIGQDLLSVARGLGVEIESSCGGKGVCKKCRVLIGRVGPPTGVSPLTEVATRFQTFRSSYATGREAVAAAGWPARRW